MANNGIELAKKEDIPTVPTKNSELRNDSNYITQEDVPSVPKNTSDLTNDSNFITSADVPDDNKSLTNGAGYIDNSYDNSTSGLTATTIQGAIDELKTMLDNMNSSGGGA